MKIRNFVKKIAILSPVVLVAPIVGVTFSCSSDTLPVDQLVLQCDVNCIMPSQSTVIKAMDATTQTRQIKNIKWEIVNCPFAAITISEYGVLNVPSAVHVTQETQIKVKASLKTSPEVYNILDLYVVPYSNSPFCGFANGEIKYLNRDMTPTKMKIVKVNEFEYVNETPIDLFEMDTRTRPEGFDAPVQFVPLIAGDNNKYMRFNIDSATNPDHAIAWSDSYTDGAWTETIPDFIVFNDSLLTDSIKVHFACDEQVCLTINFNTWQLPEQDNEAILCYTPDEDNPHSINLTLPGRYNSFLYCPSYETEGIYSGYLKSIYCSYGKVELPDFRFEFNVDSKLEEEIKQCFSFTTNIEKVEREFDHYLVYKIDFYYQFDLSKKSHSADYWDFKNFPLLSMKVYDNLFESLVCQCDFRLDWI